MLSKRRSFSCSWERIASSRCCRVVAMLLKERESSPNSSSESTFTCTELSPAMICLVARIKR